MHVKGLLKEFFATEEFKRSRKIAKVRLGKIAELKGRVAGFLRGDVTIQAFADSMRAAVEDHFASDGGASLPVWGFGGAGTAQFVGALLETAPVQKVEAELSRALTGIDLYDPSDRLRTFAAFVARTARDASLGPESHLHVGYATCFLSFLWHVLYDVEIPVFYGASHRGVKALLSTQAMDDPDYGSRDLAERFRAFLRITRSVLDLVHKVNLQLNFWTVESFLEWYANRTEALAGGSLPVTIGADGEPHSHVAGLASMAGLVPLDPAAEAEPASAAAGELPNGSGVVVQAKTRKLAKGVVPGLNADSGRMNIKSGTIDTNLDAPAPPRPVAADSPPGGMVNPVSLTPREGTSAEDTQVKTQKKKPIVVAGLAPVAAEAATISNTTDAPAPGAASGLASSASLSTLPPTPGAALKALAAETRFPEKLLADLDSLLSRRGQVAIEGATGVGKTFLARRFASTFAGSPQRVRFVQLHPSYRYEDFIEAAPNGAGAGSQPGVFKSFASRAGADPAHRYVIVLDELGRGDAMRLLGEVYSLLEYRDQEAILPFSREAFSIPRNLFVVATVSSAAGGARPFEDAAMRRRFHFVHLEPSIDVLKGYLQAQRPEFVWVAELLGELNKRLAKEAGPRAQIGQSVFMQPDLDDDELERIFSYDVKPLVETAVREGAKLDRFDLATLRKAVGAPEPTRG